MNRNTIFFGLLALFLMYMGSQLITPKAEVPVAVAYSQFQSRIADVERFELAADERTFYFTFKGAPGTFQSILPPGLTSSVVNTLVNTGATVFIAPPAQSSFLLTLFISLFPILILVGVMIWLYRRSAAALGGGSGGMMSSVASSPARLINPETNHTKLADVAGNPGDFDDIYEIIDFLKDPEKYNDAKAKMPHGVLMYGPPGVGKTLLAKAIAGEAGVPFFMITGSDFVEMFVGVGASRVRDMFRKLREAQPAILFIDEIDTIGAMRSPVQMGGGARESDQTLNQLLSEMDGFESSNDAILIIAATNRPDMLDPALLRPGRFDRKIPLSLPDINAREKILRVHTKGRDLEASVDLRTIAKGTPGMSGADLANLVNEAAMILGKRKGKIMSMLDLDSARDKIFMGREKSLAMDEKEKRMTAYHEAGHAITAYYSPEHDPLYKVTIIPRDRALGVTMYLPEEDRYSSNKTKLQSNLVSLMGGRAAEEIQFGSDQVSTGASNDLEVATDLARNMVTRWGFGTKTGLMNTSPDMEDPFLLSDKTKELIDLEINSLLEASYNKAKELLTTHKDVLDRVSETLIEKETIDFEHFKSLVENNTKKDETHESTTSEVSV